MIPKLSRLWTPRRRIIFLTRATICACLTFAVGIMVIVTNFALSSVTPGGEQTAPPTPITTSPFPTVPPTDAPTIAPSPPSLAPVSGLYGTLQSQEQNLDRDYAAGVRVTTLEVAWGQYEPTSGSFDQHYLATLKTQLARNREKGMKVVLDLGLQYAPDWLLNVPNGRYVNQYGDSYVDTTLGKNIANLVFNQQQRDLSETYIKQVLNDFGANNFYAVRLGGGWFGELQYPQAIWNGKSNAYWGFDALAQGQTPGLANGIPVNPVPGWIPGAPTVGHAQAAAFLNWYTASLNNFQNWQIATVRKNYSGNLLMLYPAWGIRNGQAKLAINDNLNGQTSAEQNGEIQRGSDYATFIAGITDPGIVVYTTWINANYGSDISPNPVDWRPVHWLAALASSNALHLRVWGENGGRNSRSEMAFSFAQAKKYGLMGLVWAFEPDLYSGRYATIDQYKANASPQ